MRSWGAYRRTFLLVFGGLAVLYLLAGCSTLPRPKNDNSSLLVLVAESPRATGAPILDRVTISGPLRLQLDLSHAASGITIVEVPPGRYQVLSRTLRFRGGATSVVRSLSKAEVDVVAGAIVLPDWRFAAPVRGGSEKRNGIAPTRPIDRRHAAAQLKDFVHISRWARRSVSGFAPYSPFTDYTATTFNVRIESTPPGAHIIVDGLGWGDTPLEVSLAPGKHLVRLTHQGYEPHSSFITVKANGNQSFSLSPAPAGQGAGPASKATVLIERFRNLGVARYDDIAGVLTNSLAVAFRHDGIDIVGKEAASATAATTSNGPADASPGKADFARAEKAGAQAFVAGDYTANSNSLLIHAALYDTRTGLVRASVLFNGKGGIDLFDSIDRMSERLGNAVEKVLPEVGQAIVRERIITPRSVVFNTRVHEEAVIHRRNQKVYSFSVGPALVGMFDNVADPANPTNTGGRMNGPGLGINAGFDLPLSGPLSLHLATMPILFTDASSKVKVEIPVYFGPRYTFSGFMNDVYVGIQGAVHYAPASAVSFNGPSSSTTSTVGPFWMFGLNFETGLKIYTYRRLSALPSYLGFGLRLGFFGYRLNLNLTNARLYPMELAMSVYWGTRL